MPRKKRTVKRKLIGFTKVKNKYALVFRRGSAKPVAGKSRYSTKKTMTAAAKKYLK